jgi:hypothetical protein
LHLVFHRLLKGSKETSSIHEVKTKRSVEIQISESRSPNCLPTTKLKIPKP